MPFNVYYRAWDSAAGANKTGDAAQHTVSVEVDGSPITGLAEVEVGNGLYRVTLSDVQLPEGSRFACYGSSATADVSITGEVGKRDYSLATIQANLSTFDHTVDQVITDAASRNASKADVSGLSTFNASTDTVTTDTASRDASKADVTTLETEVGKIIKSGEAANYVSASEPGGVSVTATRV